MRCAVFGCNNDDRAKDFKKSDIKFFRFPKNEKIRKAWHNACGRQDTINMDNARICSKHFKSSDFVRNLKQELLGYAPNFRPIKPGIIPTENLPKYLLSTCVAGASTTEDPLMPIILDTDLVESDTSGSRKRVNTDDNNSSLTVEMGPTTAKQYKPDVIMNVLGDSQQRLSSATKSFDSEKNALYRFDTNKEPVETLVLPSASVVPVSSLWVSENVQAATKLPIIVAVQSVQEMPTISQSVRPALTLTTARPGTAPATTRLSTEPIVIQNEIEIIDESSVAPVSVERIPDPASSILMSRLMPPSTNLRKVLIDLSGTLHLDNRAIPGAVAALKKLAATKIEIKFVANTTKESQQTLYARLIKLGFTLNKSDIHSSLAVVKDLIHTRKLKPLLLMSPEAMEDFKGLACRPGHTPDAVVVGLAPDEFHYERLNEAFKCLLSGGQLIAIHASRYYKRKDGLALGPGCFVKGLEYAAQCTAEMVGKPNERFFYSALNGVRPEHAIMIGDDVIDDIFGAMNAGLRGFLVQTGKYRKGDEYKINPPPTKVVANFAEAVERILVELNQKQSS